MECWMNMILGWEVKTKGELIYLPLHGGGTNVAGTQLLAGQAET